MLASLDSFVQTIKTELINPILRFLFPLAILLFLIGVVQFIINSDSPEGRTTGIRHIIWGIVGIVIMLGVFSIINLLGTIVR